MVKFVKDLSHSCLRGYRQVGCPSSLSLLLCLQSVDHFPPDSCSIGHFCCHVSSPSTISCSQIALSLESSQGSRLSLTAGQCANQLIHVKVFVSRELMRQRPQNSHCTDTRVSEPVNWGVLRKRSTKYGMKTVAKQSCSFRMAKNYGIPKVVDKHGILKMAETNAIQKKVAQNGMVTLAKQCGTPKMQLKKHQQEYKRKMHQYRQNKVSVLRQKRKKRLSLVSNLLGVQWLKQYGWTKHSGGGRVLDYVEKVWEGNGRKRQSRQHKRRVRKQVVRQTHNIRKGGRVIECRMSKDDRRAHKEEQKHIWCHTKRSIDTVWEKMKHLQDKTNANRKRLKHVDQKTCNKKQVGEKMKQKQKQDIHVRVSRNCRKEKAVMVERNCSAEGQCWMCDKMIKRHESKVQCNCGLWYHVECMGFTNDIANSVLVNKSVVWICCKCRGSNYCKYLHNYLDISVDFNMYDEMPMDGCEEDVNEKVKKTSDNEECVEGKNFKTNDPKCVNKVSNGIMKCKGDNRNCLTKNTKKIRENKNETEQMKKIFGDMSDSEVSCVLERKNLPGAVNYVTAVRESEEFLESTFGEKTKSKDLENEKVSGRKNGVTFMTEGKERIICKQTGGYLLRSKKRQPSKIHDESENQTSLIKPSGKNNSRAKNEKVKNRVGIGSNSSGENCQSRTFHGNQDEMLKTKYETVCDMCSKQHLSCDNESCDMKFGKRLHKIQEGQCKVKKCKTSESETCKSITVTQDKVNESKRKRTEQKFSGDRSCNKSKAVIVQGSFHQGDYRFGWSAGKQCVANSLCCVLYSKVKDLKDWCWSDVDTALTTGNELYKYLFSSSTVTNEYLLINELPNELDLVNHHFSMKFHESICGTLRKECDLAGFNVMQLKSAVEQNLQQYYANFICFNGNTFVVIAQDGMYYIFDSHSRNQQGLQVSEGRSLLKGVDTWQDVHRYCTDLANSMGLCDNEQFEVTGVSVWLDEEMRHGIDGNICENENVLVSQKSGSQNSRDPEGSTNCRALEDPHECFGLCSDFSNVYSNFNNTNKDVNVKCSCPEMTLNEKGDSGSDVEIIQVSEMQRFQFIPLAYNRKKMLCHEHKIGQIRLNCNEILNTCENMGRPNSVTKIQGDGNCFFRAISFALSGTEDNHMQLRMATVNYLLQNGNKFNGFLRQGFVNVEEYVVQERMFDCGTWATEVEIMAVAHMLKTDIYTFDDINNWYIFCASFVDREVVRSDEAIYLYHRQRVHYDVVLSVHEMTRQCDRQGYNSISVENVCQKEAESEKRSNSKRRKRMNKKLQQRKKREKARERYAQKTKNVKEAKKGQEKCNRQSRNQLIGRLDIKQLDKKLNNKNTSDKKNQRKRTNKKNYQKNAEKKKITEIKVQ